MILTEDQQLIKVNIEKDLIEAASKVQNKPIEATLDIKEGLNNTPKMYLVAFK